MNFPSLHIEADVIECLDAGEFLGGMLHLKNIVIHPFPTFHISLGPVRSIGRVPAPACPSGTHWGSGASPLPGSYNGFLLVDVSLQEVSCLLYTSPSPRD